MCDMWLGYADRTARREVLMALRRIAPGSAVVFARNAQELRERLHEEEPRTVGAIVGHTDDDISDMNLAAALVQDGFAREVVLVARGASGSLRSRASRAGVARVIDATVAPGLEQADPLARERSTTSLPVARREGEAHPSGKPPLLGTLPEMGLGRSPSDDASPQPNSDVPSAGSSFAALSSPTEDSSPILAVASGRGGVGKTALVALMAGIAVRWGMDVAMVDLDLSCGNLHTCFGVGKGSDLARISLGGAVTAESMGRSNVRCAERLHLWGPCERPEMAELVMPHVASLLSYLSSRYDLVLVDTSTTFTDAVAQAVQSCDRLLVVHDERSGAIASAARMSSLAVRLGVARTRIVRVVNLGDPRAKGSVFEGRAEVGLETAKMYRIVDGGIEAEELLASGKAADLVVVDSDLTMGVASMLAQTLSELGRLPDDELARKAVDYRSGKRRGRLFGKHKEVA